MGDPLQPLGGAASPSHGLLLRLRMAVRRELAVYLDPDTQAAEVRAHHVRTLMDMSPWAMLATAANAVLLYMAAKPQGAGLLLHLWLATMLGIAGWGLRSWSRSRLRQWTRSSVRTVWRFTAHGAALGGLWGVFGVLWFPQAPPSAQLLMGLVLTGSACAGAYLMASVPMAAYAYVSTLLAGGALAWVLTPGMPLLAMPLVAVYLAVLVQVVRSTAHNATARLLSEREVRRQNQLVALLLRDFEEHTSDLLWELDREGRLVNISPRLAAVLGGPPPALGRDRFVDWLQCHEPQRDAQDTGTAEQAPGAAAALAAALALDKPFRDLELGVLLPAGPRWWHLTAKPLLSDDNRTIGWRGVLSDVTHQHQARDRLDQLAHFDALTGLANRVRLRERLAQLLAQPMVPGHMAALLCVDVDNFKTINDSMGHSVGDAVLQEVAARIRQHMRRGDLVARLGGDEFAIVLDGLATEAEAWALAQRLIATMQAPCSVGPQAVAVGLSIGMALLPQHGQTLDEVMGNADLALYAAKQGGRGRCELFVPQLGERSRRRLVVEQELRRALAAGDLALHWQPQVDIGDWQPCGAEALLRWSHPALGMVPPNEFVLVAEECGLIGTLGAWVMQRACMEAAQVLPAHIAASVNVSPAQLVQPDFVGLVQQALARSGLPAQRLVVEVTESLFMEAAPVALANLRGLKDLGVRIALDDFGTGYSSLAYLRRFPFDSLKIDRAFVRELTDRSDARAIVRTIVQLARNLGMRTIAEGVETPAQLLVLRNAGCLAMQGYLVARPMPVGEVAALLGRWQAVARPQNTQALPDTALAPL